MILNWRKNLGNTDRVVRIVIAVILVGLGITQTIPGWWAVAASLLGISQFIEAGLAY
ncbi:MAG TPA: YgaP-like transmembrane domain [Desulfobacteria bacterium]|nr:YgaP-like transmembrane domain [Desulfobacteria bacterium]